MYLDKLREFFETEQGKICVKKQNKVNNRKIDKKLRFEDSILNYVSLLEAEEDIEILIDKFSSWDENLIEMNPKLWVDVNSNIFNTMVKIFICCGVKYDLYDDYLGVAYLYRGYILKIYQGQGCLYKLKKEGLIII